MNYSIPNDFIFPNVAVSVSKIVIRSLVHRDYVFMSNLKIMLTFVFLFTDQNVAISGSPPNR